MPRRRLMVWKALTLSLAIILGVTASAQAQQGLVLSGVGPINQSMGGASVAAPIDASGAIHWNPASITGLERSELEFGLWCPAPQHKKEVGVAVQGLLVGEGFPVGLRHGRRAVGWQKNIAPGGQPPAVSRRRASTRRIPAWWPG